MSRDCEKYKELILEQIEGKSEDSFAFPEHIKNCSDCMKFFNDIQKIQNNLEEIGSGFRRVLPEIDICDSIQKEIGKIKRGEKVISEIVDREEDIPEYAEWNSYIEKETNEVTRYRCEIKLEKSLWLRQEIEQLSDIHHSIEEIGKTWTPPELDEDLTPYILEKIQQYKETFIIANESDLRGIEEELYALSDTVSESIKEIDITTKVAKKIKSVRDNISGKKALSNVIPIKSVRKKHKESSLLRYAIPASIAVILLLTFLGIFLNNYFANVDENYIRTAENADVNTDKKPGKEVYKVLPPFYQESSTPNPIESDGNSERKIRIRQNNYAEGLLSNWTKHLKDNALTNAGKLMRMGVWATLTPEEARELLQKSGLSPEAILGAVQFLPPEEAKVVLQAAIDTNPEDAYLRYAMVQTLRKLDNSSEEELYTHLTAWSQLDPANALPHFIEAEIYFRNGEQDKAITCITEASNTSNYNSYATITAKAYMEALLAKGIDLETAKLLASASMGLREVETMDEIAQTLLEYGKMYEEAGDYTTALMIYEALRDLGLKVDMSSVLMQEKLAGLRYTREAINAMFRLMNNTNSLSDMQSLINFMQTLNEMITNYNMAINSFYTLFDTNDMNEILSLLNTYLSNGNVSLSTEDVGK